MPLINLQTKLRDLKFGHDRPNGNSSNQPYIASSFANVGESNSVPIPEIYAGGSIDVGTLINGTTTDIGTAGGVYDVGILTTNNYPGELTILGLALTGLAVGAAVGGASGAGVGLILGAGVGIGLLATANANPNTNIAGGTFNTPTVGGTFQIPSVGGTFQIPSIGGTNLELGNTPDFLIRGGISNPIYGLQDVYRLGSYFTDFKSPSGLFFTLKQNILSRLAVRTEASPFLFNDRLYSPTSTLAQAGAVGLGIHLNKQGLNPLRDKNSYQKAVQYDQYDVITKEIQKAEEDGEKGSALAENNRLVALYSVKISKDYDKIKINGIKIDGDDEENLLEYPGGPGAILGIGKTRIPLYCGQTRYRYPNPLDTDRSDIIFELPDSKKNKKKQKEEELSERQKRRKERKRLKEQRRKWRKAPKPMF